MLTLIIGGSASGKSDFAERHTCSLPGRRVYIATMEPWDEECRNRIEKHQKMRAKKEFSTIECYHNLDQLQPAKDDNVLLECLSNLVANEIYDPNGSGVETILLGVDRISRVCDNFTIVTNEVFSGGSDYAPETLDYMEKLSYVNREIAKKADLVVEVVCGVPNVLKGELPCGL